MQHMKKPLGTEARRIWSTQRQNENSNANEDRWNVENNETGKQRLQKGKNINDENKDHNPNHKSNKKGMRERQVYLGTLPPYDAL